MFPRSYAPSIETCLPSMVSCTSAGLLLVALKHLAPLCHLECLPKRPTDLDKDARIVLEASETREANAWSGVRYHIIIIILS